jgi:hypothetical protein
VSEERQDPEMLAYTFSEHVADTEPEPGDYVRRFVDELFELEPGLKEHFTDLVLGELCEEVARREDSRHAHATVALIQNIAEDWRRDA